ncbi:hypothetical protein JCM11251_007776 [Rhodosporidiobolus azoricus]
MPIASSSPPATGRPSAPASHDISGAADSSCNGNGSDWETFSRRYQDGTSALNVQENPVLQPADMRYDGGWSSTLDDNGSLPEVGTMEYAKEMYRRYGYAPALKNPREVRRQQTVHRYTRSQPKKMSSVHDLTELACELFDMPVAVVNVVLEDKVVFISSKGWHEKERDPDWPLETVDARDSMCPHAMGKGPEDGCFIVPDTTEDWRFQRSPLVQDGKGPVGFFASSNINLDANIASGPSPASLPIGSFCLIDSRPRPALTEKQQRTLKKMAQMAAKEFQLAFEKERSALVEHRNAFTADLFRSLLVYPSRSHSASFEERCTIDSIAHSLVTHTCADLCFILDLRNYNFNHTLVSEPPPTDPPARERRTPSLSRPSSRPSSRPRTADGCSTPSSPFARHFSSSQRDPAAHGSGSVGMLDYYCAEGAAVGANMGEKKEEWTNALNGPVGLNAITQALAVYHATKQTSWATPAVSTFPLAAVLPPNLSACVAAPIFDNEGNPALYVIVASRERHFSFEESDDRFVSSVGGILMAAMLQEKLCLADEAKLAFVGSVSHELRTPIFAIAGNLQLVREQSDAQALEKIEPLLDVAGCCLDTLRDILDDCLEYSKLSNQHRQSEGCGAVQSKLNRSNVLKLVTDVIKSCWSKEKRYAEMMDRKEGGEGVAIVLESHIPPDLEAMLDVGGLKRVGVNLLGNALKFTSRGSVTIRLSFVPPPPDSPPSCRYIRFQASDTGKGMSQEFIRDSLFTPFKQADPYASGAGLGVSLAAQLVNRMGGKIYFDSDLGVGTTATVVVPVEVISASYDTPLPYVHNFSDELHDLAIGRRTPVTSRAPSPSRSNRECPPSWTTAPYAASPLHTSSVPSPAASSSPALSTARSTSPRGREDHRRTEELASGAIEALGAVTADVKTDKERALPELDGPLEDEAGGDQVKVLVADDNAIARRVLCAFLKSKNITFAEANGGAQAIELFKSFRPNLVWCDMQMPEIDGVRATKEMRQFEEKEKRPPARIVAISGHDTQRGEHGNFLESGHVDFWVVKGGTSLRTLTSDMLDYAKRLSTSPSPSPSSGSLSAPSTANVPHNLPNGLNGLTEGIKRLQQ